MKKWLSIAVLAGVFLVSWQHTSLAAPQDLSGFVCNVNWISPEQNSAGGIFGFLTGRCSSATTLIMNGLEFRGQELSKRPDMIGQSSGHAGGLVAPLGLDQS